MDLPAPCPHCETPFVWEIDLTLEQEVAWAHPEAPILPFDCPRCGKRLEVTFEWSLQRGGAPRHLKIVGGGSTHPRAACVVLVDRCPHSCGARLGLQIPPDDPWAKGDAVLDEPEVLGGYRCPTCDGEGRLVIAPVVRAS